MRKIYAIICLGLAFLAASSCNKQEEEPQGPVITILASDLTIPAKGGAATIEFISEAQFTVTVDKDWCDVSVDETETVATFTAAANESLESRYAKAVIKAGDETRELTIQQFGFYTSGFEPSDIRASSDAATFEFKYEYDEEIVAGSDADWVTVTTTADRLIVNLAENTMAGTPENPARYAEISWSLGYDHGVINVIQNNLSFMKVDSNWNVHYDGVQTWQGQEVAIITNDVADPSVSGKYGIYAVAKSEFTASGLDMNDYALLVSDAFRDEIMYFIDYYAAQGRNYSFADFIYEETDYEIFNPFDDGDYIAFALGFTDDGETTGHYAYKDFTVKSSGSSATGYDAWLGEWEVKRGSTTDIWTIVADEQGSTYTITGIEGKDYPVSASYSSTGQIEVRAQDEIGVYSSSNYGECTIGLFGGWDASSFATGTYAIFTGKISGNKAELTPETVRFSDGSSNLIERVQFVATTSDGRYLTISQDKTPLPVTITRKGSGGDNPGGGDGTGSDKYNSWLGSWSVDSGAFNITLTQNAADKSMWMRGWQFEETFFDSSLVTYENGAITIYGDTSTPVAGNVNIGVPEGPCDLYYAGFFLDGNDEYYLLSAEPYDVATASIQSDGSAVFAGNQFTLRGEGDFVFIRYELIAAPISDPDGGVYTFESPNNFPLTAVKAGTSSVKAMGAPAAGKWTRSDVRKSSGAKLSGMGNEMLCTPYQAVPEVPVRYRKHVKTN